MYIYMYIRFFPIIFFYFNASNPLQTPSYPLKLTFRYSFHFTRRSTLLFYLISSFSMCIKLHLGSLSFTAPSLYYSHISWTTLYVLNPHSIRNRVTLRSYVEALVSVFVIIILFVFFFLFIIWRPIRSTLDSARNRRPHFSS